MADLIIKVKTQNAEAIKGLRDLGLEVDDVSKKTVKAGSMGGAAMASFIGNFASQAAIAAIKAFGNAIGEMTDFVKDSVKESARAEKSLNDFNIALALSGKYSKKTSEDFAAFASEIQRTTVFED